MTRVVTLVLLVAGLGLAFGAFTVGRPTATSRYGLMCSGRPSTACTGGGVQLAVQQMPSPSAGAASER